MKRILFVVFILTGFNLNAQLTEAFSDGNFTSNPLTWSGDTTQFIVNPQFQLQLNNTAAGSSYLSANFPQGSLDSVEWRCFANVDFAPSSSNFGRIYLVSDQADLESPLNGYYIQLGEALSNDAVELFRQDGSTVTSVARCTNAAIASSALVGIRITRSANAEWKIYIDYTGGTNYTFEASGTDATHNSSSYFGVLCVYTLSNATDFYFDDFYTGPIAVDNTPPSITSATVISSTTVDVKFNEPLEAASSQNVLNYSVDNAVGNPLIAQQDAIDKSLVHLSFATSLIPGPVYTLTVNNISDQNNNNIVANSTVQFALPDTTKSNDIVINEIMFNPQTGGADFVELYNRSSKALDLKELQITNINEVTLEVDDIADITASSYILLPGAYAVLTNDPSAVRSVNNSGPLSLFFDITGFPSYNFDEGGAVLLDKSGVEIDRFIYDEKYHFKLLNDVDGISLERISPERPSSDISNWHSAAADVGFATPGLKNSQYSAGAGDGSEVSVEPEIFSPDNDGNNDVVNIHYKFDKPGYTATVKIYSSTGKPVLDLVKSELLGTEEGVWSWDGIDKDNEKSPVGIYVLYIDAFNKDGDRKKIKKTCVLGAKL
jgi:hypothetical protein